jgi:hypothetical protein
MVFMLQAQRQLEFLPRHITFQYKQQPLDFPGDPVGRSNSPTYGHFKIPHPDELVIMQ